MKTGLDFLVIGAQKAGTTALFEYLRRHPQLSIPAGKEVPFFSHEPAWDQGWAVYAQHHFALAPEDQLWGTVTPQYMRGAPDLPGVPFDDPETVIPRRIVEQSPHAKLVAILRDPVDRAYSQHQMQLMNQWDTRTFARAVDELLQPDALEETRRSPDETNSYIVQGEYGRILAPYFALFDGAQILTLFHSDLEESPQRVVQTLFRFLGVDDAFTPPNLGKRYRVAASRRRFGWVDPNAAQAWIANISPLRAGWRRTPESVRARVKAAYKEVAYRIDLTNRVAGRGESEEAGLAETRERLREHYAADRRVLADLLGAEPPW
jgi:hypothetical protein